jgi:streptogramin lyase
MMRPNWLLVSRRWGVVLVVLAACGGTDGGAVGDEGSGGIDVPGATTGAPIDDGTADDEGGSVSESDGGSDDGDPGSAHTRFDVGTWDEIETCDGSGGKGVDPFSIIWIANSPEGTVSKIDTKTATEIARYATGPGTPDPSRTSVNLRGDVAVTNRRGSVTKIAANLDDCVDVDGDAQITTSQAPDDVLPWGEDECVLWHHETGFDETVAGSSGGPRGTAWTGGTYDEQSCETVGANLWVGWRNQPDSSVTVRLLDGELGTTIGEAIIGQWPSNWGHGPYGAAADAEGNYWGLGTAGSIFRIAIDDFSVERWDNPVSHVMYGIALDAEGTPWIAGWSGHLWAFDRTAEEWVDKGGADGGPARMRGLAIDKDGYAWIAGNNPCGLVQYDTQSDTLVNPHVELPDCGQPVGVSIDVDGAVWVVDRDADRAYKVDPVDYAVTTVEGLVDPYTYSDMTGAGLGLVVNPPG